MAYRKGDDRTVARMQLLDLGDHDHIEVMFAGDFHLGDDNADLDYMRATVEWANGRPNRFMFWLGDLLNIPSKSSVSFQYGDMTVDDARKLFVRIFEKLKPGKVLGAVRGNHDMRSVKDLGVDMCDILCAQLGIPYFEDELHTLLRFGSHYNNGTRVAYSGYLTHGTGGGRTVGSTVNALMRLEDIVTGCDFYAQGHSHKPLAVPMPCRMPDPRTARIVEKDRFFISTGGALTRGGYGVRFAYRSLSKAYPIVRFDGTRKGMTAIIET